MDVKISSTALTAILREAAETPGWEVCGLLLGASTDANVQIHHARSCRNVAADPARRFEIDPAALLAAHRAARSGGDAVLGHYHSHPVGRAVPSPRDAADAAADGSLWLIVAGGQARLWQAVADGPVEGRFAPVAFAVRDPAAASVPAPSCAPPSAPPEDR